tara:strand:- start:4122 stop:4754 length:633 start_codon:yes stop_codon:yes gene_type:complete
MNPTIIIPRRPRRCGSCSMFGHNRRKCHLIHDVAEDPKVTYENAMNNYQRHCYLNGKWVAAGGDGYTIPAPKEEDYIKKTPFELACENKCKVIHEDTCCICMEALGEKNIATTPCGHQFHFGCLSQHCDLKTSCPTCRAVIRPELKKRDLNMPGNAEIARFSARAAATVIETIAGITDDDEQAAMFTEVIVQIVGRASQALIAGISEQNR